jgi:hypothetical protein
MKILILPLILILLPVASLFIWLKYAERSNRLSVLSKIMLALVAIPVGLLLSHFAILMSIESMQENGIECMTGVVSFIPVAFLSNAIGIPILLFSKRDSEII